MENEKAPYWRRYDWDGDGDVDDKDAVVYLARHVLIRLTDTNKDPVPKAKCRIIWDEATVYECDKDGVAHIPVSDWSIKGLDLEWEKGDAETQTPGNRYYWKNSFDLDVCDRNDPACSHRLTNLGFTGATLGEQVNAYQEYFGRSTPSNIEEIRTEMADWHDGGTYPGQVTTENTATPETFSGSSAAAQSVLSNGEDQSITAGENNEDRQKICLKLFHVDGALLANCTCTIKTDTGATLSGTTDDEGVIFAALPPATASVTVNVKVDDSRHPEHSTFEWHMYTSLVSPVSTIEGASLCLKRLGYWAGGQITQWGSYSTQALIKYQLDNNLQPSGELDSLTIEALNSQSYIELVSPPTNEAV